MDRHKVMIFKLLIYSYNLFKLMKDELARTFGKIL